MRTTDTNRQWIHLIIGLGCFLLLSVAVPRSAEAQNCSQCTSCSSCSRSWWGTDGCDFLGGCCHQIGNACNPEEMNLMLQPSELRVVDTDQGQLMLAKLGDNEFVTWSCEHADYLVYRQGSDGVFRRAIASKSSLPQRSWDIVRSLTTAMHAPAPRTIAMRSAPTRN